MKRSTSPRMLQHRHSTTCISCILSSRAHIATGTSSDRAMMEMKEEVGIVRNAWSKMGYEWFAKELRGAQEGNDIEGNN